MSQPLALLQQTSSHGFMQGKNNREECISAGVTLGAALGHALATLLAVTGGALASKYISERALGYAGGSMFLVFAALTLFGVF